MNARPDLVNEAEIRGWFRVLHDHIRQVTAHRSDAGLDPGMIQLTAVHPTTGHAIYPRFKIGDWEAMAKCAIMCAALGYNVWVQGRTVRSDLESWCSPKLPDTVCVFALVVDDDGYRNVLGLPESFAVQTSIGHEHRWYLTCALTLDQALAVSPRFKAAAGADSDSGVIAQDYRAPGTPNYPTPKKIAAGRTTEQTFVSRWAGHHFSFEQLDARLPQLPQASHPPVPQNRSTATIEEIDAKLRAYSHKAPRLLAEPTGLFYPNRTGEPDRSNQFLTVMRQAIRAEIPQEDFIDLVLFKYPTGCARKYLADRDGCWLSEAAARTRLSDVVAAQYEKGAPNKYRNVGGVTFGGSLSPERQGGDQP